MTVTNNRVLDGAVDGGKRAFKCQCAGRKSRPARSLVARHALQAATSSEAVGNRDLVGAQHVHAEMPMPADGCPRRRV